MTSGVVVRPLQAQDNTAWLELWHGYLAFYEASIPTEMTALTWARLLDPMTPLHGWVAQSGAKFIGFAHILEHASTWSPTPYVYLEDLFVDQTERKCGAGSALIRSVYTHADKIGSTKVYWQTAFTNETARKLYDQIGKNSGFMVYQRS